MPVTVDDEIVSPLLISKLLGSSVLKSTRGCGRPCIYSQQTTSPLILATKYLRVVFKKQAHALSTLGVDKPWRKLGNDPVGVCRNVGQNATASVEKR